MKRISVVVFLFALSALSGCFSQGGSTPSTGANGSVAGATWSTASSPTTYSLYNVMWTGSNFVAFGNQVKATSSDGVNWTAQPTTVSIDSAAWDGTKFVGVSGWSAYTIRTSTDGITWIDRLNVGSAGGTIDSSLVWANNKFLVLGTDATGATTSYISGDGISWTAYTNNTATTFHSVIWDGSQYVAVGNKVANSAATAAWSADGITWQTGTLPTTATLKSVAYNGTVYVATAPGGAGSDVWTTADGTNWTRVILSAYDFGNSIIWAGNKFVGAGWWWRVMSSPNGSTWTEETSRGNVGGGMYSTLYGVAYSGTRYVAVGEYGQIMYSN